MRILHIGLASHFTDRMLYQDNILADLNAKDGHDVTFISDTYYYKDGILAEADESDIRLDNGVRLIRIKYDHIINDFITKKFQKARKLMMYLSDIRPETILYHGLCGYELMDVANYARKTGIPLYIDSHEDFGNTAMTPISKFAYKYIHGIFIHKALPVARKILYINNPTKEYLQEMYHISENILEFFPLGGLLMNNEMQETCREDIIRQYGFSDNVIICSHSGKLERGKKTEEVLHAFGKVKSERLRLLIFGSIPESMKSTLEPLILQDKRVHFLGWKSADEQRIILGATDLYLQPGTGSSNAQIALCNGCALLVNRHYKTDMEDAVFYEENEQGIEKVLRAVLADDGLLEEMKEKGNHLAAEKYDYEKLSNRYLL